MPVGDRFKGPDGTIYQDLGGGQYMTVAASPPPFTTKYADPLERTIKTQQVQKGANELQMTPDVQAKQKAEAQKAQIEAKTAQELYDAAHPQVGTPAGMTGPAFHDYLAKTNPARLSYLVALIEGRQALTPQMARTPAGQAILQQVSQLDPTFDATNFATRAAERKNAAVGRLGQSDNALITTVGHLARLHTLVPEVFGTPVTPFNSIANYFDKKYFSGGQTGYEQNQQLAGNELAAAYNAKTEGKQEQGGAQFDEDYSTGQKEKNITGAVDLLMSKLAANRAQFAYGNGAATKPDFMLLPAGVREQVMSIPGGKDIAAKYFAGIPAMGDGSAPLSGGGTPSGGGPRQLTPEQKAQFFDILQKQGADKADAYLNQFGQRMKDRSQANRPYSKDLALTDGTYANSYAGQGLSGVNEGIANTLGAPVDLTTAALNLIPKGINAVTNSNIPTINDPVAGGDWWKRRLSDLGSILPSSADPSKQFVRRVGQSVGAAAIPVMGAGSAAQRAAGLISGLGGGIGAATAQQVAPGNPLAEIGGEVAGGGLTGFGLVKAAQRAAQRGIEAAVPTVSDLKDQAAQLYQRAETRGVTATPDQTNQLAATIQQMLKDEGQLGPAGKITNADTNTSKAFNLIQQYAGQEMKPSEMGAVRKVLADSRQSSDPTDRRLGSILLDNLDDWVSPLAPEFDQARSVAGRYLQAQDLEQARDLAGARASQFTGSGFENALRTEYRGLDRNNIKGNNYFSPDVTDAIQAVARGTPTSNLLRGIGRLAPTGPVSGMGSLVPALGVASLTNPATGGAVGSVLAGGGFLGRLAATRMGINAADNAELIARNGGTLPQADLLPKSVRDYMALLAAGQAAKYQSGLNQPIGQ